MICTHLLFSAVCYLKEFRILELLTLNLKYVIGHLIVHLRWNVKMLNIHLLMIKIVKYIK